MKLLLDIGNSRIKWAFGGDNGLRDAGSCNHRGQTLANALRFMEGLRHQPTAAAAVNVAGSELSAAVAAELRRRFAIDMQSVTVAAEFGALRNGYAEPGQLGVDRWAAMVGAWRSYSAQRDEDLVVVDAGTALTVDVIRADGQHLGGLIVPGLALMEASLGQATSDIAHYAGDSPPRSEAVWLADNTRAAVATGALSALCGMVERVMQRHSEQHGSARLLLTGGDAEYLRENLAVACELKPLLVLEGVDYLLAADD